MSPNEAGRRNRVAVVAIHGVGDHPQFQTAREIGDLLLDLDEKDCEPRYVPFKERTLRLNVRPVKVTPPDHADDPSRWGPLDSMARAAVRDQAMILESSAKHSTAAVDHKFMAPQLAGYKGEKPEDAYETIRLEGSRTPSEGPKQDVDVYEMYWSDLTKTGTRSPPSSASSTSCCSTSAASGRRPWERRWLTSRTSRSRTSTAYRCGPPPFWPCRFPL
jgi:hypothetical protein